MQAINACPSFSFDPCAGHGTGNLELMKRAMRWVSAIALTVFTLWVLTLG